MAIKQFRHDEAVHEGSDAEYACVFRESTGAAIQAPAIVSITATLKQGNAIINGRDNQNVLNANGGTLNATTGEFRLLLDANDNDMISNSVDSEQHRLTLKVTYTRTLTGEMGSLTHEVRYFVLQLADV